MANKIIPDDLITTINDFKSTSNGQMINIHGKDYATVAHRVAVLRRNLGAKLSITTEVVSIDENKVVSKKWTRAFKTFCFDFPTYLVAFFYNFIF